MDNTEAALMHGVEAQLKSLFSTEVVSIEYDESFVPANVGHNYFVVLPGIWTPGPHSDHVLSEIVGVDVVCYKRATHIPRDRQRDAYLKNLQNLNDVVRQVMGAVHMSHNVRRDANEFIEQNAKEGFIEPLRWAGNGRPESVDSDVFGAGLSEPRAGLRRRVQFRGAYRIQSLENL